eukprot:GHVO01012826.1.p1 GENE.GHVO01012826.1~~GHVO01012826.1.p1  ORF type:complete len:124 (-),score=8.27 GHVO01012826.1:279-650(-)
MCTGNEGICPSSYQSCDINNGKFTCTDTCVLFNRRNHGCERDPRMDLIFVQGECKLRDGFPYCDCGKTFGDILDNFYDGQECVSTAFIVTTAAVGAGFFIIVLLSVVICLAVANCNKSDKIEA